MTVQDLIDQLESFDPDAEVKLAIQPTWAFQHSIEQAIESREPIDAVWGVRVVWKDGDEEFNEATEPGSYSATCLAREITRTHCDDPNFDHCHIAGICDGEILSADQMYSLEHEATPVVYIAEGGQDCYLPAHAANELGW